MKERTVRIARSLFYFIGATFLLTGQVYAYVDPATTSYVIQIVAGIVIACGTGIGIFWNKMRRKIKNRKQSDTAPEDLRADNDTHGGVMTAADLLDDDADNTDS